uniref:CPG4 domain-containing protein n=1 Tax=Parastrongyloides trichosuri TaxID=131310 RepID=A0A0N4ZS49_PARTI
MLLITNKPAYISSLLILFYGCCFLVDSIPTHRKYKASCFEKCTVKIFEISEKVYDSGNISSKCSPYYAFGDCVEKCYDHFDTTTTFKYLKKCDDEVYFQYKKTLSDKKCLQKNFAKSREQCSLQCSKEAVYTDPKEKSKHDDYLVSENFCSNHACKYRCLSKLIAAKCRDSSINVINSLLAPFYTFKDVIRNSTNHKYFIGKLYSEACQSLFSKYPKEGSSEVTSVNDANMNEFMMSKVKPTPPAPLQIVSNPTTENSYLHDNYIGNDKEEVVELTTIKYDNYNEENNHFGKHQQIFGSDDLYQANFNFNNMPNYEFKVEYSDHPFLSDKVNECGEVVILDDDNNLPKCSSPTLYYITSEEGGVKEIFMNGKMLKRYNSGIVTIDEIYEQYRIVVASMSVSGFQVLELFNKDSDVDPTKYENLNTFEEVNSNHVQAEVFDNNDYVYSPSQVQSESNSQADYINDEKDKFYVSSNLYSTQSYGEDDKLVDDSEEADNESFPINSYHTQSHNDKLYSNFYSEKKKEPAPLYLQKVHGYMENEAVEEDDEEKSEFVSTMSYHNQKDIETMEDDEENSALIVNDPYHIQSHSENNVKIEELTSGNLNHPQSHSENDKLEDVNDEEESIDLRMNNSGSEEILIDDDGITSSEERIKSDFALPKDSDSEEAEEIPMNHSTPTTREPRSTKKKSKSVKQVFHGQGNDRHDSLNNVLPDQEKISYGVDGKLVARNPRTLTSRLPVIKHILSCVKNKSFNEQSTEDKEPNNEVPGVSNSASEESNDVVRNGKNISTNLISYRKQASISDKRIDGKVSKGPPIPKPMNKVLPIKKPKSENSKHSLEGKSLTLTPSQLKVYDEKDPKPDKLKLNRTQKSEKINNGKNNEAEEDTLHNVDTLDEDDSGVSKEDKEKAKASISTEVITVFPELYK